MNFKELNLNQLKHRIIVSPGRAWKFEIDRDKQAEQFKNTVWKLKDYYGKPQGFFYIDNDFNVQFSNEEAKCISNGQDGILDFYEGIFASGRADCLGEYRG